MRKPRKDYVYVAYRIDPNHPQNLGDFRIRRVVRTPWGDEYRHYHYASEDYYPSSGEYDRRGTMVNRRALVPISKESRIYKECLRAVDRLLEEEESSK